MPRRAPVNSSVAESMGAKCGSCALKNAGPCVFGRGPENAKVAIVGEGPGGQEVDRGMPFVGKSGEMLDSLLMKVGLPRSSVYVTNATLHMPPGGDLADFVKRDKRKHKEDYENGLRLHPVDACRERLFKELRTRKCKRCKRWELGPGHCACKKPDWLGVEHFSVVIPVGNAAMRALVGFEGIMNWRGSILDVNKWRTGFYSGVDHVKGVES